MTRTKMSVLILAAVPCLLLVGCAGSGDDLCSMAVQHLESCMGVTVPELSGTCDPDQAQRVLDIDCDALGGARDTYLFGGGFGGLLGTLLGGGGADGDFGAGDLFGLFAQVIDAFDGNDNDIFGFGGSSSSSSGTQQCGYKLFGTQCYKLCLMSSLNYCAGGGGDCQAQNGQCYCRQPAPGYCGSSMSGSSGSLPGSSPSNAQCGYKTYGSRCYKVCLMSSSYYCANATSGLDCMPQNGQCYCRKLAPGYCNGY